MTPKGLSLVLDRPLFCGPGKPLTGFVPGEGGACLKGAWAFEAQTQASVSASCVWLPAEGGRPPGRRAQNVAVGVTPGPTSRAEVPVCSRWRPSVRGKSWDGDRGARGWGDMGGRGDSGPKSLPEDRTRSHPLCRDLAEREGAVR